MRERWPSERERQPVPRLFCTEPTVPNGTQHSCPREDHRNRLDDEAPSEGRHSRRGSFDSRRPEDLYIVMRYIIMALGNPVARAIHLI
jgi:hypothetical protein